jgi:hypothetical protein
MDRTAADNVTKAFLANIHRKLQEAASIAKAAGCNTLSNEAVAQCRDRNGAERTRLQPHARHEHRRHQAAPGGNPGVKSSCCYAHRVTVQVAQRDPSLRPG